MKHCVLFNVLVRMILSWAWGEVPCQGWKDNRREFSPTYIPVEKGLSMPYEGGVPLCPSDPISIALLKYLMRATLNVSPSAGYAATEGELSLLIRSPIAH
jgi:hypothetical protein